MEEIANRTGLKADKIVSLLKSSRSPAYLEDLVIAANKASKTSDNPGTGIEEVPVLSEAIKSEEPVFENVSRRELSEKITRALSNLTSREEQVIRWRYGIGKGDSPGEEKTLQEISRHFKLTGERIRQIEVEALMKLKLLMEPALEGSFRNCGSGCCADKARVTEPLVHEARAGGGRVDKARAGGGRVDKDRAIEPYATIACTPEPHPTGACTTGPSPTKTLTTKAHTTKANAHKSRTDRGREVCSTRYCAKGSCTDKDCADGGHIS